MSDHAVTMSTIGVTGTSKVLGNPPALEFTKACVDMFVVGAPVRCSAQGIIARYGQHFPSTILLWMRRTGHRRVRVPGLRDGLRPSCRSYRQRGEEHDAGQGEQREAVTWCASPTATSKYHSL